MKINTMKILFFLLLIPMFSLAQNIRKEADGSLSISGSIIFHNERGEVIGNEIFSDSLKTGNYVSKITSAGDNTLIYLELKWPDMSLVKGKQLSVCSFNDMNGSKINIPSDDNSITLLCFWDITCSSCIKELTALNILIEEYTSLKIIAITPSALLDVKEFLKKKNIHWNNLTVITDYNNEYKDFFQLKAYPFSILVDREGTIKEAFRGKSLRRIIQVLNEVETGTN